MPLEKYNFMHKWLRWCVHDEWYCYNDIFSKIWEDKCKWIVFYDYKNIFQVYQYQSAKGANRLFKEVHRGEIKNF